MSFDLDYWEPQTPSGRTINRYELEQQAIRDAQELIRDFVREHKKVTTHDVREHVRQAFEQYEGDKLFRDYYYAATSSIWTLVGRKVLRLLQENNNVYLVWNGI